jgi:transcriptional regulator with XRE-family HTH domain
MPANEQPTRNEQQAQERRGRVYEAVVQSDSGVLSTEVAEAVDIHRVTATEHLEHLERNDRISVRKPNSRITLWYVATDQHSRTGWGSVSLLSDADITYLQTGETGGIPESHRLTWIWERLCDEFWEIPFDDAPIREEMELLGARLGYSAEELLSMAPGDLYSPIAEEADRRVDPYDDIYRHDTINVNSETVRSLRNELGLTQHALAERVSERVTPVETTIATRISTWEKHSRTPDRKTVEGIVGVLQQLHQERFGSSDVEPTWLNETSELESELEPRTSGQPGPSAASESETIEENEQ